MGILKWLFGNPSPAFKPDFSKTEYDNWLDYLDSGGTTDEWEKIKRKNHWRFFENEAESFINQKKNIKPFEDRYYTLMEQIQANWSKLYKSKNYHGNLAKDMEKDCLQDIQYYEELWNEEKKYGTPSIRSVPAFTRLSMLYERQERYEECIEVCKKAGDFKINECNRMNRMIKKIGRKPTAEELKLINDFSSIKESERDVPSNHIDRTKIPAKEIDAMQRIKASASYQKIIYNKYYKDYPEMPFISQDRELNTNWIEQTEMFPNQNIIPKSMMTRFQDGLLSGHVYMLYWIKEIHRKRIPSYFEYKYGINFTDEQSFLQKNGYLTQEMKLTDKGFSAISLHYDVIENHN